jgi:hypothetical protein
VNAVIAVISYFHFPRARLFLHEVLVRERVRGGLGKESRESPRSPLTPLTLPLGGCFEITAFTANTAAALSSAEFLAANYQHET